MPAELDLAVKFKRAKWKVKIREKERLEPPHVSILRGTETWRIELRTGKFRDKEPSPTEVPSDLVRFIKKGKRPDGMPVWDWLCQQWDKMYPNNKVSDE